MCESGNSQEFHPRCSDFAPMSPYACRYGHANDPARGRSSDHLGDARVTRHCSPRSRRRSAFVALVVYGAQHLHFVHEHEMLFGVLLAGPFALVALTRTWRWRSHKVHVTNERILVEGGVLHHQRSAVELRDIAAIRIDQRMSERLTRRGVIYLETVAGTDIHRQTSPPRCPLSSHRRRTIERPDRSGRVRHGLYLRRTGALRLRGPAPLPSRATTNLNDSLRWHVS